MNISQKIQNWNEVLLQSDRKIKEVVDQASGQTYFEVAEYKNDSSFTSRAIHKLNDKFGIDLRFSFLNIDRVVHTTKHADNLEEFIKNYRFNINTENFAYSKVTVKEFDVIQRSNALDKVMAKELPTNLVELPNGFTQGFTDINQVMKNELNKKYPLTVLDIPKGEFKVELDDFAKELVSEYSKPEHKNTIKIVKDRSLGRGR